MLNGRDRYALLEARLATGALHGAERNEMSEQENERLQRIESVLMRALPACASALNALAQDLHGGTAAAVSRASREIQNAAAELQRSRPQNPPPKSAGA